MRQPKSKPAVTLLPRRRDSLKRVERQRRRRDRIVTSVEAAKIRERPNRAHLKISDSRYTGRRLPVHSTSYAALFFLLAFTSLITFFIGQHAVGAGPPIVEDGSVNVSGIVAGPPPVNAAIITEPDNGDRFSDTIITVAGTCDYGLAVEIYRNNAFAGSAMCDSSGHFSLQITIIPGKNILIAKVSDALNQYGPNSQPVTVYLDEPNDDAGGSAGTDGGGPRSSALPFLIYTTPVQRGIFPEQTMNLKYEVDGGVKPYAISFDWDDWSENGIVALKKRGNFAKAHVYENAGQYTIQLKGTDSEKRKAFTQTIAIVNGQSKVQDPANIFLFGSAGCEGQGGFVCRIIANANVIWPLLIIATTMTFSFWMGERAVMHRYKKILRDA